MKVASAAIIVVAVFTLTCSGCLGNDDERFNVAIKNDTGQPVLLGWCSAYCGSFADTWDLKPGQAATTGQDPDGVFRPMEVLSTSKKVLGCLPLRFSKTPTPGSVIEVSQMVSCGKSVGAAAVHGRDWPYSNY
jgi:hypothetical protein